jgi:hypothetical protein
MLFDNASRAFVVAQSYQLRMSKMIAYSQLLLPLSARQSEIILSRTAWMLTSHWIRACGHKAARLGI